MNTELERLDDNYPKNYIKIHIEFYTNVSRIGEYKATDQAGFNISHNRNIQINFYGQDYYLVSTIETLTNTNNLTPKNIILSTPN